MNTSTRSRNAAFTLAETLVGASVAVIGMAAVGLLNSAHLRYVQSARQSNAATLALQERVEQMRLVDWRKVTDPSYLRDTLYATAPKTSGPLARFTEEIQVEAYEPLIDAEHSAPQKLIVQRLANGNRLTLRSGSGLATQRLAKVELQIGWVGTDGRSRERATTTIISNGGISRMNLPGFGGTTTGTVPTGTTTPLILPPTGTPAPGTPALGTPAPTTPDPHGRSDERGNVGGKSGKN